MLTKTVLLVVAVAQWSYGYPWDSTKQAYNVHDFLSSRIVGGVDAPEGSAKHMVALLGGSIFRFLTCGGSIVSNGVVLTAAHCIEPFVLWGDPVPQLVGVVGTKYWNNTETTIHFSGYKLHPDWDWATIKNDIGVLYTAKEIKFNRHVAPIALNYQYVDGRQSGYVTGWGRIEAWGQIPHRLQMLEVSTIPWVECFVRMTVAGCKWGSAPPVDPQVEICTLHSVGHGMCNGDSGSALIEKGANKQIGIVSWGFPCARGAPDVFVRVSAFKQFVQSNIVIGKHD